MKQIRHVVNSSYRTIIGSIAFYPALMVTLAIAFAIFILYFEYTSMSASIKELITVALVTNAENARLVLGTIVGGIISLTVFSFSMVMVVINRASATLSPRVIPGIISKKSHQVVLGFYLSTIIYSLMLIININAVQRGMEVPSLGIFFSMISAIICLGLFVYFIDSISKSIQVDEILNNIYKNTRRQLIEVHNRTKTLLDEEVIAEEWYDIAAFQSGYFNDIDTHSLISFLRKNNMRLRINVTKGFFIPKGFPFISVDKDILNNRKMINDLNDFIVLQSNEDFKEHFNFGFMQITEIAIKALSPGINDPGTAQKAIDLFTILFTERMKFKDINCLKDKEEQVRIIFREWPFEHSLFHYIGSIREYGKRDIFIMINLLDLIKNLMYADSEKKYFDVLSEQAESIIQDVKMNNDNFRDQIEFNKSIDKINRISDKKFNTLSLNR